MVGWNYISNDWMGWEFDGRWVPISGSGPNFVNVSFVRKGVRRYPICEKGVLGRFHQCNFIVLTFQVGYCFERMSHCHISKLIIRKKFSLIFTTLCTCLVTTRQECSSALKWPWCNSQSGVFSSRDCTAGVLFCRLQNKPDSVVGTLVVHFHFEFCQIHKCS